MTPKVSLRQAREDPFLLGAALAGPSLHGWRSILLATMGEPLTTDELEAFSASPDARLLRLSGSMSSDVASVGVVARAELAVLACYLAGLCDPEAPVSEALFSCLRPT